jgi:hypothetical protein
LSTLINSKAGLLRFARRSLTGFPDGAFCIFYFYQTFCAGRGGGVFDRGDPRDVN